LPNLKPQRSPIAWQKRCTFKTPPESFIGFGLSAFLIIIPFLYLYHDLKSIFSKKGNDKESGILDDDL
jgi:hypothetical protein